MHYQYSSQKGKALVALSGRIEQTDMDKLKEPFQKAANDSALHVEVDFSGVTYIGSSGIAVLMQAHKRFSERKGQLTITSPNANIASLFKTLKLNKLFGF
jgi:anti-sigma B factor antagonist